jgi:hypothetical protein
MLQRLPVFLLILGLLLFAGCGYQRPALPAPVPARGKVLLPSGQPLRGGRIQLNRLDPPLVDAFGDVGSDGSFTLTTYQPDDGAVPGRYVVTISPYNYHHKSGSPVKLDNAAQIPVKYLETETSKLEVEITNGENILEVKLK